MTASIRGVSTATCNAASVLMMRTLIDELANELLKL